jgi:WD40 repeat protein
LAFSPDDKTLALASYGGVVQLWDLATGKVRRTLTGSSVAFSPDCKTLATGTGTSLVSNGSVKLWDAHTGQERLTCQGERSTWVFCVQFSPDGTLVAQTTDYGTILLWDVATGALHASLKGHTSPINCVAFHPDGKTLASASTDKTVRLWDVATGQERITLVGHAGPVRSVAFAPDGNTLASGSTDGTVKLWRAATDREAAAPRTEREPDEPDSTFAMINQVAMLRASGQSAAAEQIYHKVWSRLEKLAAAFPKEPDYQDQRARSHYDLGNLLASTRQFTRAEKETATWKSRTRQVSALS